MRYANLLLIAALLAVTSGCGLTKKITNNRDEGALRINRQVNVYAIDKDRMIVVEIKNGGKLTRDEGGDGQHSEMKLDPTKLKPK